MSLRFQYSNQFFLEEMNKEPEQKQKSIQQQQQSQNQERERLQQNSNHSNTPNQNQTHSPQQKQSQMLQQEKERSQQNSNSNQNHSPQQKQSQIHHQQLQNQQIQNQQIQTQQQQEQTSPNQQVNSVQQNSLSLQMSKMTSVQSDLNERLNIATRANTNSVGPVSGTDLEGLADVLKSEITASLSNLVDSIVTRFVHQRRFLNKQSEAAAAAAEQLNKDLMMATQLLDRKSPRTKVADRTSNVQTGNASCNVSNHISNINCQQNQSISLNHINSVVIQNQFNGPRLNDSAFSTISMSLNNNHNHNNCNINNDKNNNINNNITANGPTAHDNNSLCSNSINLNPHIRHSQTAGMFQTPKPPQVINPVAAAALYNSMNVLGGQVNQFCMPETRDTNPEQNEALSLVIQPKKKRHKVTDTRITPRTVSRILAQDGVGPNANNQQIVDSNSNANMNNNNNNTNNNNSKQQQQQFNQSSLQLNR